jgi:predicted double-glycine peptidase
MKGWRIFLAGVILLLATQACIHYSPTHETAWPSAKRVSNLISVPLAYQCFDYTCGVGALQSVLYYYGKELRHEVLAKALQPDEVNGTRYKRMLEFSRSLGFRVDVLTQMTLCDLKKFIDGRKPVIVLIQAWPDSPVKWAETWTEGHYSVAVGYDEENLYFMDPSTLGHYTFIPAQEFLDRWHDTDGDEKLTHFGMVITKEGPIIYNPDMIRPMN